MVGHREAFMITRKTIHRVLALVSVIHPDMDCMALEAQLARSLRVYQDRGEFDGSLESAIECLTLAEYEIEGV